MKVALIGKEIHHSLSPKVYLELTHGKIHCDLLDFNAPEKIPSLKELFKDYAGIAITSPYKRHFLNQVTIKEDQKSLLAINCIYKENGLFFGVNTDYLAMLSLINNLNDKFEKVIILGDGVMSHVCEELLRKNDFNYEVHSRKKNKDFDTKNFIASQKVLIINTCSRQFVFKNLIDQNSLFWDMNYNHAENKENVIKQHAKYLDGEQLLREQAILNLSFWSIIDELN